MSRRAVGESAVGAPAIERVRTLLPADIPVQQIASVAGLSQGRSVLLRKCVQCHDLRTVLAKPRTPASWAGLVKRMAERSVFEPISDQEQWYATAYLVAISPDLQKSILLKRPHDQAQVPAERMKKPAVEAKAPSTSPRGAFDLAKAKSVFESTCNGCHSLRNVEQAPPTSEAAARDLVARMVDNGLSADQAELEQIVGYLARTYGRTPTDRAPGQPGIAAVQKGGTPAEDRPRDDRGRRRGRGR